MLNRTFLFGVFFILCVAINATRIFNYNVEASSYRDFINPYVGTALWLENKNPYDDSILKSKWDQIKKKENLSSSFSIGIPEGPFVYPIVSVPLFSWIKYFSYTQAYVIWLSFCLISLIIIYIYTLKLMNYYSIGSFMNKLWFTGVFLSIKFLYPSFFLGQPAIVAFAFALSGYYYFIKDKTIPSGILLGLASLKITILLPFVILLILDKKWKILAITTSIIALLAGIFFIKDILVSDILTEYSKGISALNNEIYTIKEGNYLTDLMTKSTELIAITTYFINSSFHYSFIIKAIYCLVISIILYPSFSYLKHEKLLLWSLVSIWSLLIVYHLMYDLIILLPLFIVFKKCQLNIFEKTCFLIFLLIIILPINTILDKIHASNYWLSMGYLHIPIALVGIQIVIIRFIKRSFAVHKINYSSISK